MNPSASANDLIALRPRRLGHANIFVSELERSMDFYRRVCGLTEVFREAGIQMGFLSNGNSHHDVGLMQIAQAPRVGRDGHVQIPEGRGYRPGLNHLGFEMENEAELVAAFQRARRQGFNLHRVTDHGIARSLYLFDVEGNLLEFYADAIDDWRKFYASHENQLISGDWTPDASSAQTRPLYSATYQPTYVEGAVFATRRLVSATLAVNDLAAMTRFYVEIAGMQPVEDKAGDGEVALAGSLGEPSLVLAQRRPDEKPGLRFVSFELAPQADLDLAQQELARVGIMTESFDSRSGRGAMAGIMVTDPDGLRLEFHRIRH